MPGWPTEDDRKLLDRLQEMFPEGFEVIAHENCDGPYWTFEFSVPDGDEEPHWLTVRGPTMADAVTEAVKHAAKARVG